MENDGILCCLIDTPYCTPHQARDKESYLPNIGGAIKGLRCFEITLFVIKEFWKYIRKGFACTFLRFMFTNKFGWKCRKSLIASSNLTSAQYRTLFIVLALIKIRKSTFILHVNMRNFKD